jgi:hypothetical protein
MRYTFSGFLSSLIQGQYVELPLGTYNPVKLKIIQAQFN